MEQKERMEKGLIYDPGAPELTGEQQVYMEKLWKRSSRSIFCIRCRQRARQKLHS